MENEKRFTIKLESSLSLFARSINSLSSIPSHKAEGESSDELRRIWWERKIPQFSVIFIFPISMAQLVGKVSVNDNDVTLYRFPHSGLTLFTVHNESTIVNGYFVFS